MVNIELTISLISPEKCDWEIFWAVRSSDERSGTFPGCLISHLLAVNRFLKGSGNAWEVYGCVVKPLERYGRYASQATPHPIDLGG